MDSFSLLDLIKAFWPVVVVIVALIAAGAVYAYMIREQAKEIKKLSKEIKNKLYKDSGETIYMIRDDCKEARAACSQGLSGQIEELKGLADETRKDMKKIMRFVGAVENHMDQLKGGKHAKFFV